MDFLGAQDMLYKGVALIGFVGLALYFGWEIYLVMRLKIKKDLAQIKIEEPKKQEKPIEDEKNNKTRFYVISTDKKYDKKGNSRILHLAGFLFGIIATIVFSYIIYGAMGSEPKDLFLILGLIISSCLIVYNPLANLIKGLEIQP